MPVWGHTLVLQALWGCRHWDCQHHVRQSEENSQWHSYCREAGLKAHKQRAEALCAQYPQQQDCNVTLLQGIHAQSHVHKQTYVVFVHQTGS